MFVPLTIFLGLAVAGPAFILIFARIRPRYVPFTAVAIPTLLLVVWLMGRASLPISLALPHWPAGAYLPPWTWRVDELAWQLSALVLALGAGGWGLAAGGWSSSVVGRRSSGLTSPALIVATFVLMAAGLAALWADSVAGLLGAWMGLDAAWLATLVLARQVWAGDGWARVDRLVGRLGLGLLGLFFLWLAAAALPQAGVSAGLATASWPVLATSWLLAAAVVQMGIFPLHVWRPLGWSLHPAMTALLHTIPAVAGVSLLARVAAGGNVVAGYSLPLTLLAMLGLVVGVGWAWSEARQRRLAAGWSLAQTSLILLTIVWAGPETVAMDTRALVLAGGILFLMARADLGPRTDDQRPRLVFGPWSFLAMAALLGLPLTAGFAGRAALYAAWVQSGRFVLLLVAVLAQMLLVVAAGRVAGGSRRSRMARDTTGGRWQVEDVVLVILSLGLLAWPAGGVSVVAWVVVFLPVVGGWALARFGGRWLEAMEVPAGSQPAQIPALQGRLRPVYQAAGQAAATVAVALREAGRLVEGEGGLLWLLVLAVVLVLGTGG